MLETEMYARAIHLYDTFQPFDSEPEKSLADVIAELALTLNTPIKFSEDERVQILTLKDLLCEWPSNLLMDAELENAVGYYVTKNRRTHNVFRSVLIQRQTNIVKACKLNLAEAMVDAIVAPDGSHLQGPKYARNDAADLHRQAGHLLQRDGAAICEIAGRPLAAGEVVITRGYYLPARFVIHCVEPQDKELQGAERDIFIRQCYGNITKLAGEFGIKSLALPLLGTTAKDDLQRSVANAAAGLSGVNQTKIEHVIISTPYTHIYKQILGYLQELFIG